MSNKKIFWGGFSTFLAIWILLSFLSPGSSCSDGWHSSSIGMQGACSHHGGVSNAGFAVFLISVFAGCIVSFIMYQLGYPLRQVTKILTLFNRINSFSEYLEFKYPNQYGKFLTFKIKPEYIEELKSNNRYIQYTSFNPDRVTIANMNKIFMQGLDKDRHKNIRFRISRIADICLKREYSNVSQQNSWDTGNAHYSNRYSSTENRQKPSTSYYYTHTETNETKAILDNAIKNHKVITFSYTDRFGKKTNRIFTPQRIVRKGATLCVEGFDSVKNDNRVFAITRMRDVKFLTLQASPRNKNN